MFDRRKAFTMIEMIISMSIMAFFVIAIAFSVNKKEQQRLGMSTGGYFACYKDANNSLKQKTEIRYADTTYKNEGSASNNCTFELPEGVNAFNIELIGGGGGAGGASNVVVSEYETQEGNIGEPFVCGVGVLGQRENCRTDDGCFSVSASSPAITTISNQLSEYMSNDSYNKLFLKDISVVVQGGSDLDANEGARCGVVQSFAVGNKVLCVHGEDETGTDMDAGLARGEWTSSSKGVLKLQGNDLIVAQGKVAYDGYNANNAFSLNNPICVKGMHTDLATGVHFEGRSYEVELLKSLTVTIGKAGAAGAYGVRTNETAKNISTDRKIVIKAEDIGNGGRAGGAGENGFSGGSTKFVLPTLGTLSASGGAGGGVEDYNCTIEKSKIASSSLAAYEQYSECYKKGQAAVVSQYVNDKVFPTINPAAQAKMRSASGMCDENACSDAKVAQTVSFGNGGSAGALRVWYDYIKQFQLFNADGVKVSSTPVNDLDVELSSGANGSGGAIVISW